MRSFEIKPAIRKGVPLLIGIFGASGGGKTYSGLRLATGITSVSGGRIIVIDTESSRALAYSDLFSFDHMDFGAPFGSDAYLAAIRAAYDSGIAQAPGKRPCIIVDSQSHEHENEGGYLQTQEAELARLSQGDQAKAERVRLLSWSKPSRLRQEMINGILQVDADLIFCFRAKEKVRPVKRNGRTEIEEQGWMPIGGPNLLYEMSLNILLHPSSNGVPSWRSEYDAERSMMKLPQQFREIFKPQQPLSEDIGAQLAQWARGGAQPEPPSPQGETPIPFAVEEKVLYAAAKLGTERLLAAWKSTPRPAQEYLKPRLDSTYKPLADEVDMRG